MESGFILDSNIAVYLLQGLLTKNASLFLRKVLKQIAQLSLISKIELLCWDEESSLIENFIDDSIILPISDEIVVKTIEIRRKYKTKLPDAIIAATAIIYNCKLITGNENDFRKIEELSFINTFKS